MGGKIPGLLTFDEKIWRDRHKVGNRFTDEYNSLATIASYVFTIV